MFNIAKLTCYFINGSIQSNISAIQEVNKMFGEEEEMSVYGWIHHHFAHLNLSEEDSEEDKEVKYRIARAFRFLIAMRHAPERDFMEQCILVFTEMEREFMEQGRIKSLHDFKIFGAYLKTLSDEDIERVQNLIRGFLGADDITLEEFMVQELPVAPTIPDYTNPVFGGVRTMLILASSHHPEDFILKPSRQVTEEGLFNCTTRYYENRGFSVKERDFHGIKKVLDIEQDGERCFTINISLSIDDLIRVSVLLASERRITCLC